VQGLETALARVAATHGQQRTAPSAAQNLLEGLRKINQSIQAASRLRVGQAGTDVVAHCRNAIRQDNFQSLFTIMQQGVPR